MKRKLLMQQQASTSSELQLAEKHVLLLHISFLRVLVVFTCDMYMCRLRHINDPVLSSLKMEGIRLFFSTAFKWAWCPHHILLGGCPFSGREAPHLHFIY
jgi:hypothetical protein